MTFFEFVPFAAAASGLALAVLSVTRKKPSMATWCFSAGMTTLALDSLFMGLSMRSSGAEVATDWLAHAFTAKAFVPVCWLGFSLCYSRAEYRRFLDRWKIPLALLALLPIGVWLGGHDRLFQLVQIDASEAPLALTFGPVGKAFSGVLLIASVLILTNLEQTFRAAVGTMRWRIKFVFVAVAVIFGARIYVRSQAILFPTLDLNLLGIESASLLIGCACLTLAYVRTGWAEIDVYPSLAVLRSSMTALVVGGYLFVVGVLAHLVRRFGGAELFQFQAFVVLVGMAGLVVLLLSDRVRQRIHGLAARHFGRAQYDSVRVWTLFSQRLATVRDQAGLSEASVRLISETFDVLSVSLWLLNGPTGRLGIAASTARQRDAAGGTRPEHVGHDELEAGLRAESLPFDLDAVSERWALALRELNPATFANGGRRWCVPLRGGEQCLGAIVLADRVNGVGYTVEELELLKCIADQIGSVLLNLRLSDEVVRAKELGAFRTMSAFFVHDLKNAAASLNLMLKNLPVHFDDPAFRADALRAVGNTARRIDNMIARLSTLRQQPEFRPVEADLNKLVSEALDQLGDVPAIELTRTLHPLPRMLADHEQVQSVVTNLVLNARDAVESGGQIEVITQHQSGQLVLSIVDNGCGMSQTFLKDSLFRPFQSTKSKGLGIGLFQSRAIVQAHGGSVQVESAPGKGTTFQVRFPAMKDQ